jgi:hypothetical protein
VQEQRTEKAIKVRQVTDVHANFNEGERGEPGKFSFRFILDDGAEEYVLRATAQDAEVIRDLIKDADELFFGMECRVFILRDIDWDIAGSPDYNSTEEEHGRPPVGYSEYLGSGDFVEAVFENWESEFLQMGLYVMLTAFLFQRGSAESKDPEAQHPDDGGSGEDHYRADAPWPVRRGGLALKVYENSLRGCLRRVGARDQGLPRGFQDPG